MTGNDLWKHGSRIRYLAAIGVALFIASSLIGSLSPDWVKESLYSLFSERAKEIEKAITSPEGVVLLPLLIFSNNIMVSLLMLALFPTVAGPWIFMGFQGFATGAIISYHEIDEGIRMLTSIMPNCSLGESDVALLKISLLIPHGIFEIPGVSLFMATSARLSFTMISYISWKRGRRSERPSFIQTFKDSLLAIMIGTLLLIVAAFVESFITPMVGAVVALALCSR